MWHFTKEELPFICPAYPISCDTLPSSFGALPAWTYWLYCRFSSPSAAGAAAAKWATKVAKWLWLFHRRRRVSEPPPANINLSKWISEIFPLAPLLAPSQVSGEEEQEQPQQITTACRTHRLTHHHWFSVSPAAATTYQPVSQQSFRARETECFPNPVSVHFAYSYSCLSFSPDNDRATHSVNFCRPHKTRRLVVRTFHNSSHLLCSFFCSAPGANCLTSVQCQQGHYGLYY